MNIPENEPVAKNILGNISLE